MVDIYKSIDSLFYSKKPEINFDESLLDQLDENERKDIEAKIVRLCQHGYEDCYKYIPYLKYEDIENKLDFEYLKRFSSLTKLKAFYYLLMKTKDSKYMKAVKEICDDNIATFTWALYSTSFIEFDESHRKELNQYLKERAPFVENDPQNLCVKIYERELSSGTDLYQKGINSDSTKSASNRFRL